MKKYLWVMFICFSTTGFAQSLNNVDIKTKNSWEEFQKTAVLSALLDQCQEVHEIKEKKEIWQKFSKEYSSFLVEKNKFKRSQVIQIVADALFEIDEKYGDDIPVPICLNALEMTMKMQKKWTIQKDLLIK